MRRALLLLALAMAAGGQAAYAQVIIETVPIGNPGNAGEVSGQGAAGGYGPTRVCGAVHYDYRIGTFEVTTAQYTEFLNAVAGDDTYQLYHANMWNSNYGCKIQQIGSSPNYTYTVATDWANRPVNYVNWGDAARFCNWLHNGQPTGAQGLSTTEDGSYYLNGAMSDAELLAVAREPDATWVIPSEDEWYKAAFHKNNGASADYWNYPTQTDTAPTPELPPGTDMTNGSVNSEWAAVAPYFRTEVGAYNARPSDSAYATFDQGGNVWEWTEAIIQDRYRGVRGGSLDFPVVNVHAAVRYSRWPTDHGSSTLVGFRIANVPSQSFGLAEHSEFVGCLSGDRVEVAPACLDFDLDYDGDVDLVDLSRIQLVFGIAIPRDMALVPRGYFQMGDAFYEPDPVPRSVHTESYFIDRYEVTNARYAEALNWANVWGNLIMVTGDGVFQFNSDASVQYCGTNVSSQYNRITWNGSVFGVVAGKEDHPMVEVSWYGAVAYCNWRSAMEGRPLCYDLSTWTCDLSAGGYRLPTEAEWEKAARGGSPGHRFAWSDTDTIQHTRANYNSVEGLAYDTSLTRGLHPTFCVGGYLAYPCTSPVGYFAPNRYGLYDMTGNVWEWCNDGRKGGSWIYAAHACRVAHSGPMYGPSQTPLIDWGFRCIVAAR